MNLRSILLAAGLAALTALTACPAPTDGLTTVPAVNTCSDDNAASTCMRDSHFAGTYPEVDSIIEQMRTDRQVMGCGLGLSLDGEMLYARGYGLANQDGTPFGLGAMAAVGSVSKTMTAMGIMKRFEGQVDLTVGELLPDAPETIASLTLRQLLSHMSGLDGPNYLFGYATHTQQKALFPKLDRPGLNPRAMWYGLKDLTTPTEYVSEVMKKGVYSNGGFRILGSILDAHTVGTSCNVDEFCGLESPASMSKKDLTDRMAWGYEWFVRDLLASSEDTDLHMTTPCVNTNERNAQLTSYATPYLQVDLDEGVAWTNDDFTAQGTDGTGRRGPSGGWMMTVGDLLRLGLNLYHGGVIDQALVDEMRTHRAYLQDIDFQGGYGLLLDDHSFPTDPLQMSFDKFGHGGNLPGVAAFWDIIPLPGGRSIGAAIVCNSSVGSKTLRSRLAQAMDVVYADFISHPPSQSPITYDTSMASCDGNAVPVEPEELISADYGVSLQHAWANYLDRAGLDWAVAEQMVRNDLTRLQGGRDILTAFDRGDIGAAAQGALRLLETSADALRPRPAYPAVRSTQAARR